MNKLNDKKQAEKEKGLKENLEEIKNNEKTDNNLINLSKGKETAPLIMKDKNKEININTNKEEKRVEDNKKKSNAKITKMSKKLNV